MLFISRCVNRDYCCVVDTDDNMESMVPRSTIRECLELGIVIEGASINGEFVRTIPSPPCVSKALTKLKVMCGVDIRVYKDNIVYIELPAGGSVEVRLSDYASKFSFNCPIVNICVCGLILDDKLTLIGEFDTGLLPTGCWYDIKDCTNPEFVKSVYEYLIKLYQSDSDAWAVYVTDLPERVVKWQYIALLSDYNRVQFGDLRHNKELCDWIADTLYEDFSALAEMNIYPERGVVKSYRNLFNSEFLSGNCDYMKHTDSVFTLYELGITESSVLTATRFRKFLKNFEVPDRIKKLYISMCEKVRECYLSAK